MLGLATGQPVPPTGPSLQTKKRAQSVPGKNYPTRQEKRCYPHQAQESHKQGNFNTDERIPLLNRFIELFGVEKIDGYLADREFIGTEFVRHLIKNEIKFRVRIKHNTRVARRRNGTAPARSFFLS